MDRRLPGREAPDVSTEKSKILAESAFQTPVIRPPQLMTWIRIEKVTRPTLFILSVNIPSKHTADVRHRRSQEACWHFLT
jgi:hypothetical protein